MQEWLAEPLGIARWMPPLWFLGVYERLLHGGAAPAFAREMARYAVAARWHRRLWSLLTYPLAWARMRRMAIEGSSRETAAAFAVVELADPSRGAAAGRARSISLHRADDCQKQSVPGLSGDVLRKRLALAIACAVIFVLEGQRPQRRSRRKVCMR